jgi:hypothetical protein
MVSVVVRMELRRAPVMRAVMVAIATRSIVQ